MKFDRLRCFVENNVRCARIAIAGGSHRTDIYYVALVLLYNKVLWLYPVGCSAVAYYEKSGVVTMSAEKNLFVNSLKGFESFFRSFDVVENSRIPEAPMCAIICCALKLQP